MIAYTLSGVQSLHIPSDLELVVCETGTSVDQLTHDWSIHVHVNVHAHVYSACALHAHACVHVLFSDIGQRQINVSIHQITTVIKSP